MVKIIDKRESYKPTYKIGDWVYVTQRDYTYLCLIAQVRSGIGQLISVDSLQANRFTDVTFDIFEDGGCHEDISETSISKITNNGSLKIEKVNVTIEITNHNS